MSQENKIKIVYVAIMWSLLVFVSYNVLTVEAAEKDDKKICKEYGGEWKSIEGGGDDKGCKFNNDKDAQAYSIRPGKSLDGTGSDAEYGRLDLGMSDEEAAAQEDAICDNEDADTTNVKLCMSEDRKQKNEKEREWYYNENTGSYEYLSDREIKDHNMESESGIKQGKKWGPEYEIVPPSEPYPTTEVIEDWSNTVSDTNYEQGQKEKYEQLAKQYTEEEQEEMKNALEEAASKSNDDESSESEEEEVSEQEEQEEEEEESSEEDNSDESSDSESEE